jgi:D-arabinose 1-dehydrogenase-like Zn-dependent alcohol dehydrogenase
MVLGHEGVGVVERTGPNVRNLKKGDRVGWGYNTNGCGLCARCLEGDDVFCPDRGLYGSVNLDQGSLGYQAVWREAFLHTLPDGLSDEDAAPLQCAGATVFTTLLGVTPNETVAIMGVGGLGHLAIQFAAKLGCKVIVLSGSESKKDESLRLGAHDFVAMNSLSKDGTNLPHHGAIDRLLVTTSAQPDWALILPMMATKSSIYPLSVDMRNFEIPYLPLILNGISIKGSLVATRAKHRQMLDFAAQHSIKPVIETFPMTQAGVREAIEKLESGKLHFRAVLKCE